MTTRIMVAKIGQQLVVDRMAAKVSEIVDGSL
jgi:hypothetical protein